jgi:hypothetical protein
MKACEERSPSGNDSLWLGDTSRSIFSGLANGDDLI